MDYHYLRHICPTPAAADRRQMCSTYAIVKDLDRLPGASRGFPRSPPEHSNYTQNFVAVKGRRPDFPSFFELEFLRQSLRQVNPSRPVLRTAQS